MSDKRRDAPVLVEFRRGGADRVETRHRGAVAVSDARGRLLWHAGNTQHAYALRSTAKPFQLLPLLLDGLHAGRGAEAPLSAADLAVMMSSHNGERMHTERIAALLSRFALTAQALKCGAQAPALKADKERLVRAGELPSALHCNCSGKHTNMLAVCQRRGWPIDSYLELDHPLQRRIHDILMTLVGETGMAHPHSIDGCSLPTFWLPLAALAHLFAYIADPSAAPDVEGRNITAELTTLRAAAMQHPELICGTGSLDTGLMRALEGRVFAKTGAAGLYAVALPEGPGVTTPMGIAIKIEDGDPPSRIRAAVIVEVLRQLGVATREDTALGSELEGIARATERNFRGLVVGHYTPVFRLEQA
ncbi:MAG: asparaginase [Gammaproteobacteria bacterium]|nr:asparaginase [Gammaproteobacteria bacterium]NIM73246.1 asparaginase [Gammaproteobacteria bacterium]NIN39065.1 asparaginase [Gammaproteobacteria bacterium]NIO24947.1 asparaginase [Gammaproteobacteria bacterium]NIO65549.1 asparaginase [Gammaproteobacteria bacterium]